MKKFIVFIVLAAIMLVQGCVAAHFYVSRPKINEGSSIKADDNGVLMLKDVKIALRPYNFTPHTSFVFGKSEMPRIFQETTNRVFYFELGFSPVKDGFVFDPKKILLEKELIKSEPVDFFGTAGTREIFSYPLFFFREFKKAFADPDRPNLQRISTPVTLPANVWTGIIVKFEVLPPMPEEKFSLTLDGLAQDGRTVSIPQVEFIRETAVVTEDIN